MRGIDVDTVQRKVMEATGSIPLMWSTGHPVGYVAHDTGPNLGASRAVSVRSASLLALAEGMTFAFDGFYSWSLENGQGKSISVEELVHITEDGAEYLIPPQQELILIKSQSFRHSLYADAATLERPASANIQYRCLDQIQSTFDNNANSMHLNYDEYWPRF